MGTKHITRKEKGIKYYSAPFRGIIHEGTKGSVTAAIYNAHYGVTLEDIGALLGCTRQSCSDSVKKENFTLNKNRVKPPTPEVSFEIPEPWFVFKKNTTIVRETGLRLKEVQRQRKKASIQHLTPGLIRDREIHLVNKLFDIGFGEPDKANYVYKYIPGVNFIPWYLVFIAKASKFANHKPSQLTPKQSYILRSYYGEKATNTKKDRSYRWVVLNKVRDYLQSDTQELKRQIQIALKSGAIKVNSKQ